MISLACIIGVLEWVIPFLSKPATIQPTKIPITTTFSLKISFTIGMVRPLLVMCPLDSHMAQVWAISNNSFIDYLPF